MVQMGDYGYDKADELIKYDVFDDGFLHIFFLRLFNGVPHVGIECTICYES